MTFNKLTCEAAMPDLFQSARLFEASTRLQSASSALLTLAKGGSPDSIEEQALEWAGEFLTHVDWESGAPMASGVSGGLAIQATAARPAFYASLLKIRPQLDMAGLKTGDDVTSFLHELYGILKKKGEGQGMSGPRLGLAVNLLNELSHGLLLQLSTNSLQNPSILRTL